MGTDDCMLVWCSNKMREGWIQTIPILAGIWIVVMLGWAPHKWMPTFSYWRICKFVPHSEDYMNQDKYLDVCLGTIYVTSNSFVRNWWFVSVWRFIKVIKYETMNTTAVNSLFLTKQTGLIGVKLSKYFNLSLVSEVFYSSVKQHTFFKFTKLVGKEKWLPVQPGQNSNECTGWVEAGWSELIVNTL